MRLINRWFHNKNEVYISLMVIMIIIVLSLELFVHNPFFVQYITSGVKEIAYPISALNAVGYDFDGKTVTAVTQDALLSYDGINRSVSRIQINCINEPTDSDAISSLSYSTVASPTTFTNLPFSIITDDAMLDLQTPVSVANIELSLTNKINDSIICENIVLNPAPRFHLTIGRTALYIGIILLASIALSMCAENTLTKMGVSLGSYSHWVFVGVIALIDLLYPIIVTWDSGHYLWLADMFRTGELANWDPIRNAAYPFSLFLTGSLLGQNQNAYLIPMVIAHCVFYMLCCEIMLRIFKLDGVKRFWVSFTVFLLIALDPTVVGYYHTLLTEYVASLVAVLSCLVAFDFYSSEVGSAKFYKTIVYFCIFIPIMWHVKQPYIGVALFPFLIASALKVIMYRRKKLTLLVIGAYVLLALLTISSQAAWNSILKNAGNRMDETRQLSSMTGSSLRKQIRLIQQSPIEYLIYLKNHYLAGANFYLVTSGMSDNNIVTELSFVRGFENDIIGHRIFNLDLDTPNLFHAPPYLNYTTSLRFTGSISEPINAYFKSRTDFSDFLFTAGYLLLPVFLLLKSVQWLRNKTALNGYQLILLGTAFLNASAHSTFHWLDRYYFYSYPLILVAVGIEVCNFLQNYRHHKASISGAMNNIPNNELIMPG